MSFEKFLKEDARLVILMLFSSVKDRMLNEHLIVRGLKSMGHSYTTDQVRTELAWLAEQNLVRNDVNNSTWVSTILRRGEDVAKGLLEVPGVQRPSADEV